MEVKTIKISYAVEQEDGSYKFEGELNPREAQFVIEVGLNFLMMQGALPIRSTVTPEEKATTVTEPSEGVH